MSKQTQEEEDGCFPCIAIFLLAMGYGAYYESIPLFSVGIGSGMLITYYLDKLLNRKR